MSTRVDPLIEGFAEAVMPIGDIFGSASGTRRCHARIERADDIMVEDIPCRHRSGLRLGNLVERRVFRHPAEALRRTKVRDQLRWRRRQRNGGTADRQQKPA